VSVVELSGVTLAFGTSVVLSDISLAIRDDEFVGVLGPNGSGKTTLMRAIVSLIPPRAGSIRVLGRPVAAAILVIGYMPQTRSVLGGVRLNGWDWGEADDITPYWSLTATPMRL
jgi:ABC-type Mn2+/Zn2+ transport system ATPase subunit